MNSFDTRFIVLTIDIIIVLGLLMTLVIRILNRTLSTSATSEPATPANTGPKTIDQMNIDIPL